MFFYPQLQNEIWLREQAAAAKTIREIAAVVGCSHGVVSVWLKKYGIRLPKKNHRGNKAPYILYQQLRDREWLADQIAAKSARKISSEIGCSHGAVMYALKAHGLIIPKRTGSGTGANYCKFPQLQEREWLVKELKTKSMHQIADEVGCSYGGIAYATRKFGITSDRHVAGRNVREPLRPRSDIGKDAYKTKWPDGRAGVNTSNWKGGRFVNPTGYVMVMAKDHPDASRAGYMLEHRLVAGMTIGRRLLPTEIVHHKNGDKGDNRPENLEVLPNKREHFKRHFNAMRELDALRSENKTLRGTIADLQAQLALFSANTITV